MKIQGCRAFLLALFAIIAARTNARADFYNFAEVTPPDMPADWSAANWISRNTAVHNVRPQLGGVVLSCATEHATAWLQSPVYAAESHTVVDFYARYTNGSGNATLRVHRRVEPAGDFELVDSVAVPDDGVWRHFTLFPTNAFEIGSNYVFRFDFDGVLDGEFDLDNVYFGRGLPTNESGNFYYKVGGAGDIPGMWTKWGSVSWVAQDNVAGVSDQPVFRAECSASGLGEEGFVAMYAKMPSPVGENIVATLEIYNQPGNPAHSPPRNDILQLVATTNDWANYIQIGDNIMRHSPLSTDNAWRKQTIIGYLPGIMECDNFRLGLRAEAHGNSQRDIYFRELELSFMVTVEASNPRHADWDEIEEQLTDWIPSFKARFDDAPHLAVEVLQRPTTDVTNLVVSLVHDRLSRGDQLTHDMVAVEGTDDWRTASSIGPFEAGEINRYRFVCEFASISGLATNSPVYYPGSNTWFSSVAGGLGGVWINEIAPNRIELAAPTGRVTQAGWRLEAVAGAATNSQVIAETINFTNNAHHGVGFYVVDLDDSLTGDFTEGDLRLVNSANVAEHTVTGYRLYPGETWSAIGAGPYLPDGDYTQYAANFSWTNTNATIGKTNNGQGFEIPVTLTMAVTNTQPFAMLRVEARFSRYSATTNVSAVASGETGVFTLRGEHISSSEVQVVIEGQAFCFYADVTEATVSLNETVYVNLPMTPGVGKDPFDPPKFRDYWSIEGQPPNWACNGTAEVDTGWEGINEKSRALVRNSLDARQKQLASVTLRNYNVTTPQVTRIDTLTPVLASDSGWGIGDSVEFPALKNLDTKFGNNVWLNYRAVIAAGDIVTNDFWFSMVVNAHGNSQKSVKVDDLRLAFQDMATVDNLILSPAVPRSGQPIKVSVDLIPWSESVSNVVAELRYRHLGVWHTNQIAAFDLLMTATNVTLANAMPNLIEGEPIEYYVAVSYEPDDADPDTGLETRYYPDNSTIDPETGAWLFLGTGAYTNAPLSFTVQGVGDVWFNEIKANPEGDVDSHFIEIAGWTNINLDGPRPIH